MKIIAKIIILGLSVAVTSGCAGHSAEQVEKNILDEQSLTNRIGHFQFAQYMGDDYVDSQGACSVMRQNNTAHINQVYFTQTHFLDIEHPFFYLVADRPALLSLFVTGEGVVPSIELEITKKGQLQAVMCLTAPENLPSPQSPPHTPVQTGSFYWVQLSKKWLRPELKFDFKLADQVVLSLTSEQLKIGPEPSLSFVLLDIDLWGGGKLNSILSNHYPLLPDNFQFLPDYFSAMPVHHINYAKFPRKISLDEVIIPPQSLGRTSSGDVVSQAALKAKILPNACTPVERQNNECTLYTPFSVIYSMVYLVQSLQYANGMGDFTKYFGIISVPTGILGGGLAGSQAGAGDKLAEVFYHELGHTLGMPHWNNAGRLANSLAEYIYPYSGVNCEGGGVGLSWAYLMHSGDWIDPICRDQHSFLFNQERYDPMTGKSACIIKLKNKQQVLFTPFTDYSMYHVYRYLVGAPPEQKLGYQGEVNYYNGKRFFSMPYLDGGMLQFSGNIEEPSFQRWSYEQGDYEPLHPYKNDYYFPIAYDVPVLTFYGTASAVSEVAQYIYPVLSYYGNLKKYINPMLEEHLNQFNSHSYSFNQQAFDYCEFGCDLTIRVQFSDDREEYILLDRRYKSTNPLDLGSFMTWGVNVERPLDPNVQWKSVQLYYRAYSSHMYDPSMIAADFLDNAVLLTERLNLDILQIINTDK